MRKSVLIIIFVLVSGFVLGCSNTSFVPEQTVSVSSAGEEEGNRIITEDTLSPQIIPEKFVSKVLDEESLLRLQEGLQAETIYDCTYSTEGKEYEIPKLDSYDKSFLVFLQTEDKGWNLKKGDFIKISFYMANEFAGQSMDIGLIHNNKYEAPFTCRGENVDDKAYFSIQLEIGEDGEYYPYLFNVTGKSDFVRSLLVEIK